MSPLRVTSTDVVDNGGGRRGASEWACHSSDATRHVPHVPGGLALRTTGTADSPRRKASRSGRVSTSLQATRSSACSLGGGSRNQTESVLVGRLPGSRTLTGVDLVWSVLSARARPASTLGTAPRRRYQRVCRARTRVRRAARLAASLRGNPRGVHAGGPSDGREVSAPSDGNRSAPMVLVVHSRPALGG